MKNSQKSLDLLADSLHLQGIDVEFEYDEGEISLFLHGDFKEYINVKPLTGLHAIQKVLEHVNWALIDEEYEGESR